MRIISDFHDYYDTAMGFGVDYDTIWLRKEKKLKRGAGPGVHKSYGEGYRDLDLTFLTHTIGFCGKIYGCVVVRNDQVGKSNTAICYNIEEVDSFVEANFKKKQVKSYYSSEKSKWGFGYKYYRLYMPSTRGSFVEFFRRCSEAKDKHEEFFIDNNTPVFVDNVLNARLKGLEFYRVFDPYTAFQEIQMFFGRLRSPEKPIPKISDADMLVAKGFDPKYSFRKDPGKKKRKRRKDK